MSMYGLWADTRDETCECYVTGEIGFDEAVEKLRGMGMCQDEARCYLDAATDEREDVA